VTYRVIHAPDTIEGRLGEGYMEKNSSPTLTCMMKGYTSEGHSWSHKLVLGVWVRSKRTF